MHLVNQVIWEVIWKYTVRKSQIKATRVTIQGVDTNPMNATSGTSILSNMRFEGPVENTTVEKSWKNATSVNMHHPKQAIWGLIWKHTVEKGQTNATSVTMHLLKEAIWGLIWTHTVEKNQTIAIRVTFHLLKQAISEHIWKHTMEKGQTMQPMWKGIFSNRRFEDSFETHTMETI